MDPSRLDISSDDGFVLDQAQRPLSQTFYIGARITLVTLVFSYCWVFQTTSQWDSALMLVHLFRLQQQLTYGLCVTLARWAPGNLETDT